MVLEKYICEGYIQKSDAYDCHYICSVYLFGDARFLITFLHVSYSSNRLKQLWQLDSDDSI